MLVSLDQVVDRLGIDPGSINGDRLGILGGVFDGLTEVRHTWARDAGREVQTANRRVISLELNSSFGLERWICEKYATGSKWPKLLDLFEGCSAII